MGYFDAKTLCKGNYDGIGEGVRCMEIIERKLLGKMQDSDRCECHCGNQKVCSCY